MYNYLNSQQGAGYTSCLIVRTDRLREEDRCQVWSGSIPAGSFCRATKKMFFSLYDVYRVRIPIMMKYVRRSSQGAAALSP